MEKNVDECQAMEDLITHKSTVTVQNKSFTFQNIVKIFNSIYNTLLHEMQKKKIINFKAEAE